jgi:hypothetical protein
MSYGITVSLATVAIALLGLVVWVIYAIRSKYDRRRSVGYIIWLGHLLIFGLARLSFDPGHQRAGFELWSSTIRIHGIIQVTSDGLFSLARRHKFSSLVRRAVDE